jgi:probable F420-dependent oxidoreductase
MKLGVFFSTAGRPDGLRDLLAAGATTAEEEGFHSIWFGEHVVLVEEHRSRYPYAKDGKIPIRGDNGLLEPFAGIAYAAALTRRIRLGTGICLVPQRSPIYTAKQVADCDVLSGGRLDFGVGIGWLREEFEALGVPFEDRAPRCREYLDAMKSLWTDEVSQHHGRLLEVPPVRMFPKPIQKPHPPIIFGGESENALRRVGDLGQGWFGFNLLPDEAAERIEVLHELLSRRSRTPESVEVTVSPYLKRGGREPSTLEGYAAAGVDQVVYLLVSQTPDDVRREIRELASRLIGLAASLTPPPRAIA